MADAKTDCGNMGRDEEATSQVQCTSSITIVSDIIAHEV